MLFISPHPKYMLAGVIKRHVEYHPATGQLISEQPPYVAEFRWGRCPPWAEKVALETFEFRQVPDGADPLYYLSSYDTDMEAKLRGWDQETKTHVENVLLNHIDCGKAYIQIELPVPAVSAPWASYEKTQWKKIAATAQELGLLEETLAYEQSREQPRPGVIEMLTAAIGAEELVAA